MSRPEADLPDSYGHKRRTTRQVRHQARARLHEAILDEDVLADADVICPTGQHDLGRHASPKPRPVLKEGRRPGFKVWKTPFWKRRRTMWAQQNAEVRRLSAS